MRAEPILTFESEFSRLVSGLTQPLTVLALPTTLRAQDFEVVSQTQVGPYPTGMAVAPASGLVYVASPSGYKIDVFSPATSAVVAGIPISGGPRYPVLSPDGSKLLAPLTWLNAVAVVSTASQSLTAFVPTGKYPSQVAFTHDGAMALVFVTTTARQNFVDIVNLETLALVARLALPSTTYDCAVAIRPDNKYAYITNGNSGVVTVIDIEMKSIAATIPVQVMPIALAWVPGTDKLLAANYWTGSISVISSTTNTVVATVPVSPLPYALRVRAQGDYAYVLCAGTKQLQAISCATWSVVATMSASGIQAAYPRTEMALGSSGNCLVVASAGMDCLYVFDSYPASASFNSLIGTVPLPDQPSDVAVSPDGKEAYVSSYGAGVLSVVNLDNFNTPVGMNVHVPLLPGLSVTFAQVTQCGQTVAAAIPAAMADSAYYRLCPASVAYSIATTAAYSGPIDVHVNYDETLLWYGDERLIRLVQRQGDTWVDVTRIRYSPLSRQKRTWNKMVF